MAPKKVKKKVQYYTVVFERYIEIIEEMSKLYNILALSLKEYISKIDIQNWTDSIIPDLMEVLVLVDSYKIFLDEKINNPSQEEIEFTTKNGIKDVLFNEEELAAMQNFYISIDSKKVYLYEKYNFSTEIN